MVQNSIRLSPHLHQGFPFFCSILGIGKWIRSMTDTDGPIDYNGFHRVLVVVSII